MNQPDCCLLTAHHRLCPKEGISDTCGKRQAGKEPGHEQLLEDGTLQTGLKDSYGILSNENYSAFLSAVAPVQTN